MRSCATPGDVALLARIDLQAVADVHEERHLDTPPVSSVAAFVTFETVSGLKGDSVSTLTKPATLETGGVVQVPLFVNVGDRLKVDPREKRYISRA